MRYGPIRHRAIGIMVSFQKQQRLQALMERDGRRCQHCGRGVRVVKLKSGQRQPKDQATEDHIKPKCDGGTDDMSNLLLACFDCNNTRGNMPLDAFRAIYCVEVRP